MEKIKIDEPEGEILLGFKELNVKLILLSGEIEALFKKKKYI
jgi:hypothetical protein